jgi:hypothetical protein
MVSSQLESPGIIIRKISAVPIVSEQEMGKYLLVRLSCFSRTDAIVAFSQVYFAAICSVRK